MVRAAGARRRQRGDLRRPGVRARLGLRNGMAALSAGRRRSDDERPSAGTDSAAPCLAAELEPATAGDHPHIGHGPIRRHGCSPQRPARRERAVVCTLTLRARCTNAALACHALLPSAALERHQTRALGESRGGARGCAGEAARRHTGVDTCPCSPPGLSGRALAVGRGALPGGPADAGGDRRRVLDGLGRAVSPSRPSARWSPPSACRRGRSRRRAASPGCARHPA